MHSRLNEQYLPQLSSNLLNEIGFLFGVLKYVCDSVVKKFTFAISSPDEFLYLETKTKTKTLGLKTKTKTLFFVLEAPRDQDCGLEDYITGFHRRWFVCLCVCLWPR